MEDKYISALHTDSADGWITRLEGYVTEQFAADVLRDLGHKVEFPEQANQAGYDLLVDGEPWQVKGGESASVINDHFAKNPDIPVITNEGLAEKFTSSDLVMGSSELSPITMEASTIDTLNGIFKQIMDFYQSYIIENKYLNESLVPVTEIRDSINLVCQSARKQLFQEIAAAELEIRRETKDTFSKLAAYVQMQKNNLRDYEYKLKLEKDRLSF